MEAIDVRAVLGDLPELSITSSTTEADAVAAMRMLASFNGCMLGVARFSGQPPWECHPAGDELLHVLEGAVDFTVLTDGGPVVTTLRAGEVFVVPRGLWHRSCPRPAVTLLFATPEHGNQHSTDEDPRAA